MKKCLHFPCGVNALNKLHTTKFRKLTKKNDITKSVMANDLKIIQDALKKQSHSTHFVDSINVSEKVMNTKVLYVFKDPIINNDNFVHIKQGVFAATSSFTLEVLKEHLDLYFEVYGITQKDFIVYLSIKEANGIVIYNAYSDLQSKNTYFLYFEM